MSINYEYFLRIICMVHIFLRLFIYTMNHKTLERLKIINDVQTTWLNINKWWNAINYDDASIFLHHFFLVCDYWWVLGSKKKITMANGCNGRDVSHSSSCTPHNPILPHPITLKVSVLIFLIIYFKHKVGFIVSYYVLF